MAVRLQMKLGVVAEHDRLPDSPDTLVVVEPSVGSVARSKGLLYLLVTSRISSRHALEATRLAAETIRNEYYYDESAGIRVCLQKAIATANKRLAHQADRLGLKSTDENGPIGVAVAVVRGNEMYVAHGRAGRGVPDPPGAPLDAARPASRTRPAVRRARARRLARRGLGRRLAGPRSPRTSWPSSALTSSRTRCSRSTRSRRWSTSTTGSWRTAAPAATARSPSRPARSPRRPAAARPSRCKPPEPLAGAPDRSPIPLADNVQAAGVAVSAAAGSAKVAAGGAFGRGRAPAPGPAAATQAGLPTGDAARPRVARPSGGPRSRSSPSSSWSAGSGLAVYAFGGQSKQEAISSVNAGQKALDTAKADLAAGQGSGRRPRRRRHEAGQGAADRRLPAAPGGAKAANVSAAVIAPLEQQAIDGPGPALRRRPGRARRLSHVQAGRRRRARSTCRRWSRARTARPYVIDALDQDGVPDRPQDEEGDGRRALPDRRRAARRSRRRDSSRSAAWTC